MVFSWKFASPRTSNLRKRERKGEEKDKWREVAGGGVRGEEYPKQKPQIFLEPGLGSEPEGKSGNLLFL